MKCQKFCIIVTIEHSFEQFHGKGLYSILEFEFDYNWEKNYIPFQHGLTSKNTVAITTNVYN